MKYTLAYKNKQGIEARLDIITHGIYSQTEIIEGTDTPFILNYKREKNDKDGYIISSSADISIYESGTFNIDNLKTSNETDIKVEYYIDNVLMWSGFVVPDFFSRVIGTPAVVNMVASDRLGSLKGQTLSNLPATITLSSLVSSCLAKTGLSLPVNLKADFTSVAGNENIFSSKVLSQRFTDTKGRNISCYDILRSILVATNSIVVQRNGEWYVVNKFQVEQEMVLPEQQYIDFNEVTVGARRQIVPVASSVGVYHEFGGGRLHPDNYDFHDNLTGWTAKNGFTMFWRNNEIIGWDSETNEPIYGNETENGFMINHKNRPLPLSFPWFGDNFDTWECAETTVPVVGEEGAIKVEVNINVSQFDRRAFMDYQVLAVNGDTILALDPSGSFVDYDPNNINLSRRIIFKEEINTGLATAYSRAEGTINRNDAADFDIKIRIFGGNIFSVLFINFVSVKFSSIQDTAKGIIYKTTQGDNFTKVYDTDTTIIGDYLTSGLNGYFYPYPIDDTSSLLTSSGNLTTRWTVPYSDEELPLLQHIARQRSRMFSVAHDLLSAEIDSDILDPLAVFRDCAGKKYVMVSGSQDFLRGTINVEIEEIAYDLEIWKRDYIYSYFGEGEEGISSVGGISESAPSAGGGGMTPEQIELLNEALKDIITSTDETTAFTDDNLLSSLRVLKEISDAFDKAIITSTDETTEFTDEKILSSLRVLKEILDNNEYLRTQFLSKVYEDTAQKVITFLEGIEIGDFASGLLGSGAAIKNVNGTSVAEVDQLLVRQRAEFFSVLIHRAEHIGGQLVISAANMLCTKVEETTDFYRCYFDSKGGEVVNLFTNQDFARCQVFTGNRQKFYWRRVVAVGDDYIELSKTDAAINSDAPEVGDNIFQLGSLNPERQSAMILSTVGNDAPSFIQYSGINSYDLTGKETTKFTRLGNRIVGSTVFLSSGVNLDEWADGTSFDIQDAQSLANQADVKAQQAINDASEAVGLINSEVERLQAQIDGKVSNWFYPYSPTLSNYPASDWTTNEIKDRHIGDTFTNTAQAPATDAGKSWRFVKNGSVYSWTQIADSDAVLALQKAAQAQATADGKSTTFLIQPTSYKLGDMWVLNADRTINGTAYKQGEILTATQDSTTFNEAHWLKRVRYTDDTAVDNLQIGGRNLFLNTSPLVSVSCQGVVNQIVYLHYVANNRLGNNNIQIGDYVTFSCEFELETNGIEIPADAYFYFRYQDTNNTWNDLSTYYYPSTIGTSGRIVVTKTVDQYLINLKYNTVRLNYLPVGTTLKIWNIQLERGNKASYWTPAPEDVQAEINAAQQAAEAAATAAGAANTAVGNLSGYVDGAFKDGVIEASEAKAIEKYINIVNTEKSNLEATYNTLYANTYLEGTAKTNLLNAKINYFGAVDTLINSINAAIANGQTTIAEKQDVDAKYASYKTTLASLQTAIENANKAIQTKLDALSTEKVNNLEIGGRNLLLNSSEEWVTVTTTTGNFISNFFPETVLEAGQEYTFSWEAEIVSGTPSGAVHIGCGTVTYQKDVLFTNVPIAGKNKITFKPTESHLASGNKFAFRWYNNGAIFTFRYRKLQLEKGSKATDWTPAPEDVQAEIDAVQTTAGEALSKANKSAAITDEFSGFDGGLATAVILEMREPSTTERGDATAGLSGMQADNVAFWAGGTYADALNGTAKAIIRHDGSVKFTDGEFHGTIYATDGEFTGTIHATSGEFSGELKSVTGSFKRLYAVDDAGNIQGLITFRGGGQIEFDCDIYSQGYNDKKARSHRYYASDIWCRGSFGAAQRNTLVVHGTYGRYYTKGLDNPYYVEKSFTSKVDSNNNTYYIIPLYGGIPIGDYGDASGFAVDLVIFLSSTSYRYLLNGSPGKKVTLINGQDASNPHRIYSMGNEVKLDGGAVREFYNIGDYHYPELDTRILGRGWIAGEQCDNTWH
jgi:hypothetical protein